MRSSLIAVLCLIPFFSSFADEAVGTVAVETLSVVSNIRIEGEAAELLYRTMDVNERKIDGGNARGKIGKNIACYLDFQSRGYHCSMNLSNETGGLSPDGVISPQPAVGGSN